MVDPDSFFRCEIDTTGLTDSLAECSHHPTTDTVGGEGNKSGLKQQGTVQDFGRYLANSTAKDSPRLECVDTIQSQPKLTESR